MDEVEPHSDEEIREQDSGIANHNRIGGCTPYTFSSTRCIHTLKTTNRDDENTKDKGFHQTDEKVKIVHVIFDGIVVAIGCHFEKIYSN